MELLHAGLDIGSTTAKAVVLDGQDSSLHPEKGLGPRRIENDAGYPPRTFGQQ